MGKPQLVGQENSVPLNEMGKYAYYFSVLGLRDEIFINDAKIKEEVVELRTQFLGSRCRRLRKITIPKSINH